MKNFDKWNIQKKKLEKNRGAYFKEGQIWNFSIGVNLGVESFGKGNQFSRPVLIVKKFNNEMFFGIPLTTKNSGNKFIEQIKFIDGKDSFLIISQLKCFSNKRFLNKIGSISKSELGKIKEKIKDIF